MSSYQGGQGQNYSSYNQSPSSYYGSNNSVAQGGYYSQWGGYDQYSGYNSAYNSSYNSGYNGGYSSGYNYNYGYGYPPPGHMPPPPMGMPPPSTDMCGAEVRATAGVSSGSHWETLPLGNLTTGVFSHRTTRTLGPSRRKPLKVTGPGPAVGGSRREGVETLLGVFQKPSLSVTWSSGTATSWSAVRSSTRP